MTRLSFEDIQGFAACGYNFPFARYLMLEILDEKKGQQLIRAIQPMLTTAEWWEDGKPSSTVNVAFTQRGLARLGVPPASMMSFPLEFLQGMKARADILGDTGKNAPEKWDAVWQEGRVDVWLGVNALSAKGLEASCDEMERLIEGGGGAALLYAQEAHTIVINGKPTSKEHFGYADGFGNPSFEGDERGNVPGQGKVTQDGTWDPLATGEFLLGYPDEAGELPAAPLPHLLARNGTFMVYRKLHQNVASFRRYLGEKGAQYPGGAEKLAAKFVGRWRDGTPVELSPERPDPAIAADPQRNTSFTFGHDVEGTRCPIGAHIRRSNPRDAFGFESRLVNRRRIIRRGLPYGTYTPEGGPVQDDEEHGVIFMGLNASLGRQFEFVQQQWIDYGNDARLGNDKDPLSGNHEERDKFVIQGAADPQDPPFLCGHLPAFVEVRGGDYFFMPSITALKLIGNGDVDPR